MRPKNVHESNTNDFASVDSILQVMGCDDFEALGCGTRQINLL